MKNSSRQRNFFCLLAVTCCVIPSILMAQPKSSTLEKKRISQMLFILGDNITAIKKYVDKGASLSETEHCGLTILHQAVELGSLELVEFLIDRKADINARVIHTKCSDWKTGYTPLMLAVNRHNYEIVNVLLSKGANVNIKGENGKTALAVAQVFGSDDMLTEWLKDAGAAY